MYVSISTYVLYEVALQLDKIIALLGPSCRLLNSCIPYPVETNEARQARADANRVAQQVSRQNEPHEVTQACLDALRLAQQQSLAGDCLTETRTINTSSRLTLGQTVSSLIKSYLLDGDSKDGHLPIHWLPLMLLVRVVQVWEQLSSNTFSQSHIDQLSSMCTHSACR